MSDERGMLLLAIARESLAVALGLGREEVRDEPWLREQGATFITLRERGDLRGCVGTIRAWRPLLDDVRSNARAAAFSDTRFPPVRPVEYPDISMEVSLLSACEPLELSCEEEALAQLRPGIDGIVFEVGERRSTFLPQVWEQLPDPWDFLAHLKHKAGLPVSFWDPGIKLWRYTVTKWAEPGNPSG
ncbi:MAG TPA: AmmeMemoRadiSam system protein A [Thermoanaerobaculia bacterium]|nr:AmmeMemoRadiSam system protein A [Thermoanaerobaculia bacterium]